MPTREQLSDHALLFGGNALYEVLAEVARASADSEEFHGAKLAAQTGRTRTQVQRELAKLKTLGIVHERARSGRTQTLVAGDSELARSVLRLPALLLERLGPLRGL